jgi:bacterioferritin (cytochrome b1)
MMSDLEHITRLLRTELTAVHQQFFHMLALRQWKNIDLLSRITAVDIEDFRNAMQIIELLVSRELPVTLPSQQIRPGSDISSILRSEFRMEEHFADVLDTTHVTDSEAVALVDRAAAPRRAYREWLAEQIDATVSASAPHETKESMAEFVAHLIALVEQAMLHAFFLWHLGHRNWADNAWRLSGAAMLYGTALVRRGALVSAMPIPTSTNPVTMATSPSEAFNTDMLLAKRCADLGRIAAEEEDDEATGRLCLRIADDCDLIANMEMDQDFPAVFGRSPVFESFAATRERHVG